MGHSPKKMMGFALGIDGLAGLKQLMALAEEHWSCHWQYWSDRSQELLISVHPWEKVLVSAFTRDAASTPSCVCVSLLWHHPNSRAEVDC